MTTPRREIRYDRITKDYAMYLDDELKGFAATYTQAETDLNDMVLDLIERGLIDLPLAALVAYDPPSDDPGEDCPDHGPYADDECPKCGCGAPVEYTIRESQRGYETIHHVCDACFQHDFQNNEENCTGWEVVYSDPDEQVPPPWDGQTIARSFHRDYRGFARRQSLKDEHELRRDAELYAAYMSSRLPKQPPLTAEHVMLVWRLAGAYAIAPSRPHPIVATADASAESYAAL